MNIAKLNTEEVKEKEILIELKAPMFTYICTYPWDFINGKCSSWEILMINTLNRKIPSQN